jgi:hypothetical protein
MQDPVFTEMVLVVAREKRMSTKEVHSRVSKVLQVLSLGESQAPHVLILLIKSQMNMSLTCSRYFLNHPEAAPPGFGINPLEPSQSSQGEKRALISLLLFL